MNLKFFTASTIAFGIVIGITSTHFHQVNELVKHGVPSVASSVNTTEQQGFADSSLAPGPSVNLAASDTAVSEQQVMPLIISRGSERDDALLEILSAIRNEQQTIRKQISESNRDIDELSFRVDTHSDSFKPLQTEVDRPQVLNSGIELLDVGGGSLLPPKQ